MAMQWYVVHTYSQFEKSVQRALVERIQRGGMQDKFGQILVPVEEVVELKSGQKSITERKFFPGYVLVEMEMTDETWHLVKSTPKVTGFLGGSAMKPTPISEKEVQNIMQQMQAGVEKPKLHPRIGRHPPHHIHQGLLGLVQAGQLPPWRLVQHGIRSIQQNHHGWEAVRTGRRCRWPGCRGLPHRSPDLGGFLLRGLSGRGGLWLWLLPDKLGALGGNHPLSMKLRQKTLGCNQDHNHQSHPYGNDHRAAFPVPDP